MSTDLHLIVTGIHQRATALPLRERFAFDEATLPVALEALRREVAEGMILATCNRVEAYALVRDEAAGKAALPAFLARWHDLPIDLVRQTFTTRTGDEVVRHLFRLTAGLDSMVLGEDQIVGQVKDAHAAARAAGTAGKILNRLVSGALAASKRVRTQTGIASHPVSVVSVALDLAHREIGDLTDQCCLIVGAGHMAELALRSLHARRVPAITIVNRTYARAAHLANRYGVAAQPMTALPDALAASDVVLCAIATPEPLITPDVVQASANGHRRLMLDLSVPRGIDPASVSSGRDRLYDIDDLQAISDCNAASRAAEIAKAEALIDVEVQKFLLWLAQASRTPTIRALRAQADEIRSAEVRRALARLPALSEAERAAVEYLGTAIVNKLLHRALVAIKDPEHGDEVAQMLDRIFHLEKEDLA
jgi:glutamyl-tRNA reductase